MLAAAKNAITNFNSRGQSNTIDLQEKDYTPRVYINRKMMRLLILLVSAAMAMAASPAFFARGGGASSSIARSSVFGVSRGGGLFGSKSKDE